MCHRKTLDATCQGCHSICVMCHRKTLDATCQRCYSITCDMWGMECKALSHITNTHVRHQTSLIPVTRLIHVHLSKLICRWIVSHLSHTCQTPNVTHSCDTTHSCAPQQAHLLMDCLTQEPHMPDAKRDSYMRNEEMLKSKDIEIAAQELSAISPLKRILFRHYLWIF